MCYIWSSQGHSSVDYYALKIDDLEYGKYIGTRWKVKRVFATSVCFQKQCVDQPLCTSGQKKNKEK